ncbi:alcohol dehydrogenase catalytic domain-containing protein [Nesterenkonia natronophila]|uniref:Alcohol dehydrogenase n=1 Tax=Nesterenkonia natronophila TaxID=2174932 RepID=A0A3A4EZY6_9MICC|nr:alcohol dehydrogenase catalytic domain-containing protein [Nesterenkonia natronophila]RJN31453.1 alcohol dehydrogenase [Nesterenkonia natronophila]
MRAVHITAFGEVPQVVDLPTPTAAAGGAVIDVELTGLCRSDFHAFAGHDDGVLLPYVPGHEFVGRISALGAGVTGWSVGQRVTAPFVCGCGNCDWCTAGESQICPNQTQPGFTYDGSWAEQVVVPAASHNLVVVPESLPGASVASLGCRFATAFRALRDRAQVRRGEIVAVFGCGGVGLSAVMLAQAMGARAIAVDVSPGALELARSIGAAGCVNPTGLSPEEVAAEVRAVASDLTREGVQAPGSQSALPGPHVTLEALGRSETLEAALRSLDPLGRHVQVGLFAEVPRTLIPRVVALELSILGSHGMAAADYPALLDLLLTGAVDPGVLVTRELGLDDVPDALAAMSRGTQPGVAVIRP